MKYTETPQQEKPALEKFFNKDYVTNFIIISLVIYLGILLVRSIITNYGINQMVNKSQKETSDLEQDNQVLKDKIKYYKSATFKEIEARAKLGYQKPGEKVIILPKTSEKKLALDSQTVLDIKTETPPPLPHYLEWWQIFFSPK